jgi:hypothetical protein
MLYREIIGVCSKIHAKHVNKAELYYRLRLYRAENTFLCIYVQVRETPTPERYRRYDLRIFLLLYIFVINHLKTQITQTYILEAKFVPRTKHNPSRF